MRLLLFRSFRVLLVTIVSLFCAISLAAMSSNKDDGEEEEGEEIIINPDIIHDNGGKARAPMFIPFEAFYFYSQNQIQLNILYPVDNLTVRLNNLYTGQSSSYNAPSIGIIYLPIAHGIGLYSIEFYINNTLQYSGYFTTN